MAVCIGAPGPRQTLGGQQPSTPVESVPLRLGPKPAMTAPTISGLWSDCFLSLPPTGGCGEQESRWSWKAPGTALWVECDWAEMDPGLREPRAHAQLLPEASVERRPPRAMLVQADWPEEGRRVSNGLVTFLALGL